MNSRSSKQPAPTIIKETKKIQKYEYINNDSLKMLHNLLGDEQLHKMKNLLTF